jgi:hypothetical protein
VTAKEINKEDEEALPNRRGPSDYVNPVERKYRTKAHGTTVTTLCIEARRNRRNLKAEGD